MKIEAGMQEYVPGDMIEGWALLIGNRPAPRDRMFFFSRQNALIKASDLIWSGARNTVYLYRAKMGLVQNYDEPQITWEDQEAETLNNDSFLPGAAVKINWNDPEYELMCASLPDVGYVKTLEPSGLVIVKLANNQEFTFTQRCLALVDTVNATGTKRGYEAFHAFSAL